MPSKSGHRKYNEKIVFKEIKRKHLRLVNRRKSKT